MLVDDRGGRKIITMVTGSGPEMSSSVVEGQTANSVLKLEASFGSHKRVFLAPSLNTLVLTSSTVPSDAALKPPLALVMKPQLGGPFPKPLDPVVLAVQNYYAGMAVSLAGSSSP